MNANQYQPRAQKARKTLPTSRGPHAANRLLICADCGIAFRYRASYEQHLRDEHDQDGFMRRFACSTCGKLFTKQNHMQEHVVSHQLDSLIGQMKEFEKQQKIDEYRRKIEEEAERAAVEAEKLRRQAERERERAMKEVADHQRRLEAERQRLEALVASSKTAVVMVTPLGSPVGKKGKSVEPPSTSADQPPPAKRTKRVPAALSPTNTSSTINKSTTIANKSKSTTSKKAANTKTKAKSKSPSVSSPRISTRSSASTSAVSVPKLIIKRPNSGANSRSSSPATPGTSKSSNKDGEKQSDAARLSRVCPICQEMFKGTVPMVEHAVKVHTARIREIVKECCRDESGQKTVLGKHQVPKSDHCEMCDDLYLPLPTQYYVHRITQHLFDLLREPATANVFTLTITIEHDQRVTDPELSKHQLVTRVFNCKLQLRKKAPAL